MKFLSKAEPKQMRIYNASGQIVFKGAYQNSIDVSIWATGLYFVQVEANGTLLNAKFLKQ
ncbi:T9SS type A sorting domain-containing protein [Flavobacterium sp. UBA6135]|uniref:T9SS type A sorting domain-containing protein n=1 Tax=Flavobacterium sp. UBA6135 TaxID=1946553 RepID=UPI0025B7B609|nr:T9SS type A sorting domain-containing protein [Flavobacterium sp. UBA6135]